MRSCLRLCIGSLAAALGCAQAGVENIGSGGGSAGGAAGGNSGASNGSGTGAGGTGFFIPDAGPINPTGPIFGEGKGCNELEVKFEKVIPTVALVIDRSSSMHDAYGAGTRWDVLRSALLDPAMGLVKANEAEVRFGLFTYTSTARSATCPDMGKAGFALGNHAAINMLYAGSNPPAPQEKGETPTGEALAAVTAELLAYGEPGPKYILLATDGEPDTCPGNCTAGSCPLSDRPGYPRDPNCGQDKSISAVQAAFSKGIRTFVLAIGNEVGAEHLQSLANAGAGLPVMLGMQANWLQYSCYNLPDQWKGSYVPMTSMNSPFFRPSDAVALSQALRTIVDQVRNCKYTLKGEVQLDSAPLGWVVLDGMRLDYNDPNGWRMNSATELEILGTACDAIAGSRAKTLQVAFPCGVFKPVE